VRRAQVEDLRLPEPRGAGGLVVAPFMGAPGAA